MPITDSPLRYPGGKTQMKKFIYDLINSLSIEDVTYVEPFAGGAGVGLSLLFNRHVTKIHINDFDSSIYSFWFSILNHTSEFINLIEQTPISIEEWYKQRQIQINKENHSTLEIGFSTFFLNRTNVSGIIKGGPIGGKDQSGKYKLDCRFNKNNLIKKINNIAVFKEMITVTDYDASYFIENNIANMDQNKTFIFFDPPYYKQGQNLYSNFYKHEDHLELANQITALNMHYWITTYDYSTDIEQMYETENKKVYSLNYSANNVRKAEELLFYSNRITLPNSKNIVFID